MSSKRKSKYDVNIYVRHNDCFYEIEVCNCNQRFHLYHVSSEQWMQDHVNKLQEMWPKAEVIWM